MARTAKITNANVAPSKNAAGLVGNTPVRAQDFNDLVGDYISSSDTSAQTVTSALTVNGGSITSGVDSADLVVKQYDATEVARIHDGGTTQSDTDMTAVAPGFGFKIPVMAVTADSGDVTVTLTAAESGSIIQCDADTNNIVFNLPVIDSAAKAGLTYTFVATTVVNASKSIKVNTAGTDGNDKFLMIGITASDTNLIDLTGDTITIPGNATIGTTVRITCLTSGASNAAELWLAEVLGTEATVTNA